MKQTLNRIIDRGKLKFTTLSPKYTQIILLHYFNTIQKDYLQIMDSQDTLLHNKWLYFFDLKLNKQYIIKLHINFIRILL